MTDSHYGASVNPSVPHEMDPETVAELRALIERTRMALAEAGRPDLVERCHIEIWPDSVSMTFRPRAVGGDDADVLKAMSLDPVYTDQRS